MASEQWFNLLEYIIAYCTQHLKKSSRIKEARAMLANCGYDCKIKKCKIKGCKPFYYLEQNDDYLDTIILNDGILLILPLIEAIGVVARHSKLITIK